MRLSGSDRIESGAEGGETIVNGEVKRGRRSNGLRGLKDAIKKRPPRGAMTLVVGVSETPELLAYLFAIQPCTRVSSPDGLARLPKIIRQTPFDLNRYFPHELSPSQVQFLIAFPPQGRTS